MVVDYEFQIRRDRADGEMRLTTFIGNLSMNYIFGVASFRLRDLWSGEKCLLSLEEDDILNKSNKLV